jgi:translation initiation factor eIF-2B subunit epsilon
VQEIFVVCRSHADLIKEAIANSKYASSSHSGIRIKPIITAQETFAPGDALRDIYTHGIISSDFVLVSGDLVSSVDIDQAVKLHKARRKADKDTIMTMVVREAGGNHPTRCIYIFPRLMISRRNSSSPLQTERRYWNVPPRSFHFQVSAL